MSLVTVSSVIVHNNPAPFTEPLCFEICYESLQALEDDLEWRLVYVGSAEDQNFDQVLESVFVGPVAQGVFRFVLEADPPQIDKIPKADLLGATVIFLSCHYKDHEFVRVGYYVSNEVPGQDPVAEVPAQGGEEKPASPPAPPEPVEPRQIIRNICADEPRVTRFPISWDRCKPEVEQQSSESLSASALTEDGMPADSPKVSFTREENLESGAVHVS